MIKLKEISIKFTHTEKFDLDEYMDYCEDQEIIPSQNHYRDWAIEQMVECLRDVNESEFKITYSKNEQIVSTKNIKEIQENTQLNCDDCVRCVSEDEEELFFKLKSKNKLCVHPNYIEYNNSYNYNILILTEDEEKYHYGLIISNNNIIDMRISSDPFCLYQVMKELVANLKTGT